MSARRLMGGSEEAKYRPYINTGGPLDVMNGKFIPGTSGQYILSGGLGLTTATIATANRFKSTFNNSCAINAMARWPDAEFHNYDSEIATIDKVRLANMSDLYLDDPEKRKTHIEDLVGRINIFDPTTGPGENLDCWFDYVKEKIRDTKIQNSKSWEVETEILDPDTGKPYRMLLPTFMGIDSWTQASSKQQNVRNEEFTAETETSKQRTYFMEDGLKKTQLMNTLPGICAKGGIYTVITGHLGRKFSIDGKPTSKDMMYMTQDETTKAMGPKFEFLMSSIIKIANTAALTSQADRRESEYPSTDGHISGIELQELSAILVRCKNAPSGAQWQMVSSQRNGIMAGLSYYNHLRNNKYFGLGSPNKVRNPLLGDLNIGRTKIFDLSSEYKTRRALELTYQLYTIQSTWTLMGQPVDYTLSLEQFVEKLNGSSIAVDDILNTRGWWTYTDAKVDRDFLSLPDALNIIAGKYKPKFFKVG